MRLIGTGTDPDNKYPEGLIFDAPPVQAKKAIEAGFANALDPKDDPGRTPSQIAAAVQRGDNLSDPTDHELAGDISDREALEIVHGESIDEPVPGGATAKAPVGVNAEDPAAVQASAEAGDGVAEAPAAPAAPSPDVGDKPLTPKQEAVRKAEGLGLDSSGTEKEIEARIADYEAGQAPPSDELLTKASELEVGVEEGDTTATVEAKIAEKEEAAAAGSSS